MDKLLLIFALVIIYNINSTAQMPPPGYERAKKIQEEREKISPMERDSMVMIDTVVVFDPNSYEQETKIMTSKISLKDYCVRYLGMGNPEILLDRQPHVIIDPETYEEITVRLTPNNKIERMPK